jgi:vacuolar-type H+-ATPase subunit H
MDPRVAAFEQVLRAERDADARIAEAQALAQARLDAARDDALAIVNRSMERIARWQQGHAGAMAQRLQARRSRAAAADHAALRPDDTTLTAAVDRVAALLTSGRDGAPGGRRR